MERRASECREHSHRRDRPIRRLRSAYSESSRATATALRESAAFPQSYENVIWN